MVTSGKIVDRIGQFLVIDKLPHYPMLLFAKFIMFT